MGNTEPQLPFFVARQGFQWWDWVTFSCVIDCGEWGGPVEMPKPLRLMLGQRTALQKLTVEAHRREQHPHSSLDKERASWCLHGALTPTF